MKNILRKLHLGGNRDDQVDGGRSQQEAASGSSAASSSTPFSSLTDWLSSVTKHNNQPSQNNNDQAGNARARLERSGESGNSGEMPRLRPGGSMGSPIATARDSDYQSLEEEYQVQLAMALSVSNNEPIDPEIEAVKRISLGLPPALAGSQAELAAYRYWAYNVLNYDDKVVDGFYDVYGVVYDPDVPGKMPSLADLQAEPVSNVSNCEVVLVNRLTDPEISKLEQRAIVLLAECRGGKGGLVKSGLAQKIAELVAEQMGGPVGSDVDMLALWRTSSWELRSSLQNNVLPLGCLQIGLTRHRALLFKVLADCVGIPCRLVKGRYYTGVDDGAVNIIKDVDGREYIIDLMGAPGALIPPDVPVTASGPTESIRDEKKHTLEHSSSASSVKGEILGSTVEPYAKGAKNGGKIPDANLGQRHHSEPADFDEALAGSERRTGPSHLRSPSWTEGIGSPAIRQAKVKDVSQYMLDAAKENPVLAQKLHDVLIESGVVAPPELFAELSPKQLQDDEVKKGNRAVKGKDKGKPPLGGSRPNPVTVDEVAAKERLQRLNSVEGLGDRRPLEVPLAAVNSSSVVSAATAASVLNAVQENFPAELIKHSPLAASAITAAVVASSMVVAAAKSDIATDGSLEAPITAAATATAAVVAATSAAVVLKSEGGSGNSDKGGSWERNKKNSGSEKLDDAGRQGSNKKLDEANRLKGFTGSGDNVGRIGTSAEEKTSNKSSRASSIAGSVMEDVAEWEIPWEELVIGERIGLGSYGEVYRADWHGTEVAVKKFLDQDISGDALEEFITEVRLMKRMRHPNVVLFMGAVTRPPNLSIVTEFLPRGSMFKLLHRPNNQLDERRRMRMALDVAKGMNYLHSSNPIIVHRDLKSPNLLVDKNWVVKVCDLGLSRMKHHTFLSSKSQAGTPEWMAPEVLRNEPSNEKADVYSFGVILWELATLQQPWQGMNPMQVVGAVGFQHRRLDIPADLDPNISKIIQDCWHNDPQLRPSFAEIMNALRPFQRPIIASQDSGKNQQQQRKLPGAAELPANGLEEIPKAPT